jgi:hypothetical protein
VNRLALPRQLIIIGVAIPLALLVGYLLATPDRVRSLTIIALVLAVLVTPVLLQHHYPILLFSWNAVLVVAFLPGRPNLWMAMAAISLGLAVLTKVLNKEVRFQNVPSVTWPLLFLLVVVVLTAKLTGGIGLRSMGSSTYGGRKFVFLVAGVIGYFAISNFQVPQNKIHRYAGMFFLSGLTAAIPNLLYIAGPAAWSLFYIFPTDFALSQAVDDFAVDATGVKFTRLTGLTWAGLAAFAYALMRYGLRGMLTPRKPWRIALLLIVGALSLLGGFRSAVIILALLCAAQFCAEGLHRTRFLPALLIALVIGGTALVPLARKLPLSAQRALSILPLDIDPAARIDAQASLDWRLDMWKALVPEIPRYFWIGKGYALSPTDVYFTNEATRRGLMKGYEAAALVGDYHSGPLSVLLPFGIFGVIGFVWFLAASIRALFLNYRYGLPELHNINTFLFSYFVARTIFYFVGFGGLSSDLVFFTGIIGLSIAVNHGVARAPEYSSRQAVPRALASA